MEKVWASGEGDDVFGVLECVEPTLGWDYYRVRVHIQEMADFAIRFERYGQSKFSLSIKYSKYLENYIT